MTLSSQAKKSFATRVFGNPELVENKALVHSSRESETVLESLEKIEKRIQAKIDETKLYENSARFNKRLILKDLALIYQHRAVYFETMPHYIHDYGKYIEDRIDQSHKTALDDMKIITMLADHGAVNLLESNISDMIYMLKRIAQLGSAKVMNGLSPFEAQKILLEKLPELDRNTLGIEISGIIKSPKSVTFEKMKKLEGMKIKFIPSRGTITVKSNDKNLLNRLHKLLKTLDAESLP